MQAAVANVLRTLCLRDAIHRTWGEGSSYALCNRSSKLCAQCFLCLLSQHRVIKAQLNEFNGDYAVKNRLALSFRRGGSIAAGEFQEACP